MGFSKALGITRSTLVSVDLVSSCLAVVPLGQGDYLRCRWRMFPSHLGIARSHLSVMRSHLWIMRHFVHRMGPVSRTSGSGSFAGMHFGLVSPGGSHVVALSSGLELVPVCSGVSCPRCLITCSCSLKITFGYVPGFVSTFSSTRSSSGSFSGLLRRLRPGD